MTAREIRDALGPLAYPLAEMSGWSRAAWDMAVYRDQTLTSDQKRLYRAAIEAKIKELRGVKKKLTRAD